MPGDEDAQAELLRKFNAAISGMELADLHALAGQIGKLAGFRGPSPERADRPELRRAPLSEVGVFRIRVDLKYAEPPIWRRLEVRSDLTLDAVHQVLQAAFGWWDYHLHRFSLGGDPFDRSSQLFLCPYDVEEGDPGDEGGIAASSVRLDETMQEPGDVLHYVYDYGDSWELTLRLEEVLPGTAETPSAVCVDGQRAAPPEDSGGMADAESLAEVLDDPAHFDVDEVNEALRSPFFVLRERGADPRLMDLVLRTAASPRGEDFAARAVSALEGPSSPDPEALRPALRPWTWFLDRAHGEGIPLTSNGYLKPADVEAACTVLPAMSDWIGKNNRESYAGPLLEFRESLQSMGLLRKHKGTLLLTRAGAAAREDPTRLWAHLASRLVPPGEDSFVAQATLVLLVFVGSSEAAEPPVDQVGATLSDLGWSYSDGRMSLRSACFRLPAFQVVSNLADAPVERFQRRISPLGSMLARAALQHRS